MPCVLAHLPHSAGYHVALAYFAEKHRPCLPAHPKQPLAHPKPCSIITPALAGRVFASSPIRLMLLAYFPMPATVHHCLKLLISPRTGHKEHLKMVVQIFVAEHIIAAYLRHFPYLFHCYFSQHVIRSRNAPFCGHKLAVLLFPKQPRCKQFCNIIVVKPTMRKLSHRRRRKNSLLHHLIHFFWYFWIVRNFHFFNFGRGPSRRMHLVIAHPKLGRLLNAPQRPQALQTLCSRAPALLFCPLAASPSVFFPAPALRAGALSPQNQARTSQRANPTPPLPQQSARHKLSGKNYAPQKCSGESARKCPA